MSSKFNSNSFLSLSPPRPKITSPHSTCSTLTDLLISPLLSSHSSPLTQLLLHFATPSLPDPLPLSVDPHSCTMSLEASLNQSQCATLTPGNRGKDSEKWEKKMGRGGAGRKISQEKSRVEDSDEKENGRNGKVGRIRIGATLARRGAY